MVERGAGAGGTLHACRECRITYSLPSLPTWLAQAALFEHLGGDGENGPCGPCNRFEDCEQGAALKAQLQREKDADR